MLAVQAITTDFCGVNDSMSGQYMLEIALDIKMFALATNERFGTSGSSIPPAATTYKGAITLT
jgi:hypothetical protein